MIHSDEGLKLERRSCNLSRWPSYFTDLTVDKHRKSYERECISGFMSTSHVLKLLKIARAVVECNLRTFKTSRVTINPEIHEQVHTIFYLLYIQQNYSVADVFDCELVMLVFFSIFLSVPHVCQTFNQVSVVLNVFLFFGFSSSFSTMFGLIKETDCQPFSFSFRPQTRPFPSVSMATSVLHCITTICTL